MYYEYSYTVHKLKKFLEIKLKRVKWNLHHNCCYGLIECKQHFIPLSELRKLNYILSVNFLWVESWMFKC